MENGKINLPMAFIGIGSVRGFEFVKLESQEGVFMYEVHDPFGNIHFEVFKAKLTPVCIDYQKRLYSETDFKYRYPKDDDFGKTAWTYKEKSKAIRVFTELKQN